MSNLLTKLEKKIGKYAIKRLPLIMITMYGIGFIMQIINPSIALYLSLDPTAICKGEVWRLFTWLLIPPHESNFFFLLIMMYFYYSIGTTLERTWGTFYYNFFIFNGLIMMVLAAFLTYGFFAIFAPAAVSSHIIDFYFLYASLICFTTYYINMSIFLGFAITYPDVRVFLFFLIPIKVKALGIIYVIFMFYEVYVTYMSYGLIVMFMHLFAVLVTIVNVGIFYLATNKRVRARRMTAAQAAAAKEFKRKMDNAKMKPQSIAKHKCSICGQTSETNPDLQFRFCSKCEGNYEYCQNHLFTHSHVKRN